MDELLKMEFNVNKEDWNAFYRMELKITTNGDNYKSYVKI